MDRIVLMKKILPYLVFAVLIFSFSWMIVFVPIPRQTGLTVRQDLYILPIIFLFSSGISYLKNRLLKSILFSFLFSIWILPLSGLWNSGISDQYLLGGTIPWSDAFTHHMNTLRFLFGQPMGQTSALRPLSLVFYSFLLYISNNNFQLLYLLICALSGLLVLIDFDLINRKFGNISAALFYLNAFFFFRRFSGVFMTEPFAFILGLISCYFLIKGFSENKEYLIFSGCVCLSVGLFARPGPMAVLPLIILWFAFDFSKNSKKRIMFVSLITIAIISGFVLNKFVTRYVYLDKPIPNRQFAEIAYGLCLGGKDSYDVMALPEMIALNNSDNVAADLWKLCSAEIRENPKNIWVSLEAIWGTLIADSERGAFSYFDGTDRKPLVSVVRLFFMIIWALGIVELIQKRKQPVFRFLLVLVIGIVLSQFVIAPYTTFRMRYHAATIWVPGIVIGLFPQSIINRFLRSYTSSKKNEKSIPLIEHAISAITVSILLILTIAPVWIHKYPLKAPASPLADCDPGETLVYTKIDTGSYFYMEDSENIEEELLPYFRLPFVRQHFHDTASVEMFHFTDQIDEPIAMIRGINLNTWQDVLVFAPLEIVKGHQDYASFCGEFVNPPVLRQDNFFIATKANFIND